MPRALGKNLTGQKFGRLTVMSAAEIGKAGAVLWNLLCDCGNTHRARSSDLVRGNTRSCGCLLKEACERRVTHGARRTKSSGTYVSYHAMFQRCCNPNYAEYHVYGGRGIRVCDRWLGPDGFATFRADLGERPAGFSLERIDVNGNYEPSNCKWIPRNEQSKNTRSTIWFSVGGVRMCQNDAARAVGVCNRTLYEHRRKGLPFPPGVALWHS